jgi:hypothetical protein
VSFERIGVGLFRTCIVGCETVGGATLLKDADKINRVTISRESSFQRLYIYSMIIPFSLRQKPSSPSLFCIYFRGPDGEASKEIAQTEEPAHSNEEIKLVVKQNYIYTLSHNEKPDA